MVPFRLKDSGAHGRAPTMTKIGRNDPCSRGSGKKYKKCCYDKDQAAAHAAAVERAAAAPDDA